MPKLGVYKFEKVVMSRPKLDTRICDHDWHANIKFKPDINKNQLNFFQNFYKSFP